MTDEATPGETESGEPEAGAAPASPDTPETPAEETPAAEAPEAPEAAAESATEPEADADADADAGVPAVVEESAVPATVAASVAVGPTEEEKRAEARKTRILLPLLLPIGAILVVAFYAFNISRVFLASSHSDTTPAVLIASGITLAILGGATAIAALPEIRTSSLVVGLSALMLVVLMAGSLVMGAAEPEGEASTAFVEPAGPAVNTLEVDALPELAFQASTFDVPGGINLIKYIDKGGTHTLVFGDNAVPGFQLAVPVGKSASKVELKADTTYTIYCTIPGHRAAGMEAEVVVGAAGATVEPGTESPTATTGPGTTETTTPAGQDNTDPASQSSTGGT